MTGPVSAGTIQFASPHYLWLLAVPAVLLPFVMRRLVRRSRDVGAMRAYRITPVAERFARLGAWPFWLCILAATACTIAALARPQARVERRRTAGVDVIVLQDGSASMHVEDVGATRWQRSMQFLRTMTESLEWTDDRMALTLFAHIAAPQIRLTRDPNTVFFFLDHLGRTSPFPLEDDTTWDTNIQLAIEWGARLIRRDEELNGASDNAKVFVLVSDGQAWSGEVAAGLELARSRGIPLFVVGVGTATGGIIPEPPPDPFRPRVEPATGPIRSALDRPALQAIAAAGRGTYFDLRRDADADISNAIIGAARRRAGSRGMAIAAEELYWWFLLAAGVLAALGTCWLRDRGEALLVGAGAAVTLAALWTFAA